MTDERDSHDKYMAELEEMQRQLEDESDAKLKSQERMIEAWGLEGWQERHDKKGARFMVHKLTGKRIPLDEAVAYYVDYGEAGPPF